jgi:hypothetical protein
MPQDDLAPLKVFAYREVRPGRGDQPDDETMPPGKCFAEKILQVELNFLFSSSEDRGCASTFCFF